MKTISSKIVVNKWIDEYNDLHKGEEPDARNVAYAKLVNAYYELSTLFYEVGWGTSFHFSYRMAGESFSEGMRRHEYYLTSFLGGLKPGSKVLDVGCGIGGPLRSITRFTGWDITGITINEYQVNRCNQLAARQGLSGQCRAILGDFLAIPAANNSFDGVYAIEATCHAPDRRKVYSEVFRVLKPGGYFACYEWCLTNKYDKNNQYHRWIKKKIEEGDALPDMAYTHEIDDAMRSSGFDILHTRDMSLDPNQKFPWYHPLLPSWNPFVQRFQFNPVGLFLTTWGLRLLEFLWLAPKGTSKIQTMLQQGGIGCVKGGQNEIFTPMYLVVCRKPL
ncbi:sterol methyltransferase [Guillardia theta CCMP2712]|uniref:Methyltransferase n=1 Tax=Guillardia theta (strain CCMP2712) TaxID=905079 RepID=L1K2B7_GUITC|nr:sterol methyltransferase [Guillardia theta CCMP2712]EKX54971.1 sterol methyltransferase [Guillardia theta CCMP2712]|eukprot:XP_005841951.1 sterol methyltransferase [Guillardia theta CCMP2712]